jgi:hypothetical protein
MSCRSKTWLFVLLVSVTLLFFVHVPQGGFQARNGPTTPVGPWKVALFSALILLLAGYVIASDRRADEPAMMHSGATPILLAPAGLLSISFRC